MIRVSMLALTAGLMTLTALGCGGGGGAPQPAAVAVTGTVTDADGKPIKDVRLYLSPTKIGLPNSYKLGADGTFAGQIIPGPYLFYFEPVDGKQAAFKAVPAAYYSTDESHTVEIPDAGGAVTIKVSK